MTAFGKKNISRFLFILTMVVLCISFSWPVNAVLQEGEEVPNYVRANITGGDFHGQDLHKSSIAGATARDADFSNLDLHGTELTLADHIDTVRSKLAANQRIEWQDSNQYIEGTTTGITIEADDNFVATVWEQLKERATFVKDMWEEGKILRFAYILEKEGLLNLDEKTAPC